VPSVSRSTSSFQYSSASDLRARQRYKHQSSGAHSSTSRLRPGDLKK
jgi:hypothetical protein